jgi:hypothetical protein
LPDGRDATPFFKTPGTDRLYSGATKRTASDPAIFCLNATDAG